jgi:hypothetical protein
MCRTSLRLMVPVLSCLIVMTSSNCGLLAQSSQQTQLEAPKVVVNVEDFCSPTKLRTSNARIRWTTSGNTAASAKVNLAAAKQSLEATVYHDGFEKGLLVSVPVTPATPDRPVAARTSAKAPKLRAYQFSLIQLEQPKAADEIGIEMAAVVEGLEPGVDYTWRIVVETDSGRLVSAPTTSEAVVCPADMASPSPVNKRKKR